MKGANNCGDGPWSNVLNITVNPLPASASSISGLGTVCQGQNSVTYTVPAIANATSYVWTLPGGASGTSSTNSITVNYSTSAVSGNITVNGHNTCGDGNTSSLFITVNPLPSSAGTISGLISVCQSQNSVTYTVPIITNATSYIWTLPTGATGSSSTNSITVNYGVSAMSGNITVKGHNSCGDGAISTLPITVNTNPLSAGAIAGINSVCQGQNSVTYTVSVISNATSYVWSLPGGATGSSSTNTINVNYGANAVNGNITVYGHNSCGDGLPSSLTITVNPLPSGAGQISGLTSVCQGQNSVTYAVPVITGATSYNWVLPVGATGSSSTNSIIVNYGSSAVSGNITVSGHNTCGDGPSSMLPVTINPLPLSAEKPAGIDVLCQNASNTTYTTNGATNAASYDWSLNPAGAGTVTNNGTSCIIDWNNSYSGSVDISVYGINGCGNGAASTPLNITINPQPSQPTINANGNLLASSASSGNQWYHNSSIINGATSQNYTAYNNGTYSLIVTNNFGCSNKSDPYDYYVCPAFQFFPELITTSGDFDTCINTTLSWSIGECLIETYNNTSNILTQGFHQSDTYIVQIDESFNDDFSVNVFPNPTSGDFTVEIISDFSDIFYLNLYDEQGKLLYYKKMNSNEKIKTISLNDFSSGIYILNINSEIKKVFKYYKIYKTK